MLICPVCNTKTEKENQEYCLNCAWEFEYFFDELSQKEKKRYKHKLQIHKSMYKKSINSQNIQEIKKVDENKFFNSIKRILMLLGSLVIIFIISTIITRLIIGVR